MEREGVMIKQNVVKDSDFTEIAEVKADGKNRVQLGCKVKGFKTRLYRVYQNVHGQIMLDPQVMVPASEAWLFQNKQAAQMVQKGLEDAQNGKVRKSKEDFSKYTEDPS